MRGYHNDVHQKEASSGGWDWWFTKCGALSGALWPLFGELIVLKSLKSQRGQDGKLYVATKGLIGGKRENVDPSFLF